MKKAFARRREVMVAELSKIDGFVVPEPGGAFYVYADVTGLLGREWAATGSTQPCNWPTTFSDVAEVAVVPGEAFGPSG